MLLEKEIINKKIGVISHDAGGANNIFHFVLNHKIEPNIYAKGPAKKIFDNLPQKNSHSSINSIIEASEILIFSTGWETEFEIENLSFSINKIYTIVFLDHWSNYRQRFYYNKKIVLPHQYIVYDKYAENLIGNFDDKTKVLRVKNYYLNSITTDNNERTSIKQKILFIDEPIKNHVSTNNSERKFNYDEFIGLKLFLNKIRLTKYKNYKIEIRLHPSEKNHEKYNDYINENVSISTTSSLIENIRSSKIIVGFESMALVVALEMKKEVFNIIPPGGTKSALPHREITSFYNEI